MGNRSVVYVDGFNFYYGAVKDTKWKWLDLQAYFEKLRQDDDIQRIVYFTSPVVQADSLKRQTAYFDALSSLSKVEVVKGRYRRKKVDCEIRMCAHLGSRRFPIQEEKQTDVAIGVRMLDDAYQGVCDRLVLVTGDSDLIPAVKMIRRRFPEKPVHVYVPANDPDRGAATELRGAATQHHTLPTRLFQSCQFPPCVRSKGNGWVDKPSEW